MTTPDLASAKLNLNPAPPDWRDRSVQPRCSLCGRFAKWDDDRKEWRLGCVWKMSDADGWGGYEHD